MPDTLVGTDSHTTMINGLGVVGWGVGGIEAEAVMLGQPLYMLMPEVVGFELTGELAAGATATDLVLTVTRDPAQRGRGRQVRRVLRRGRVEHVAGRPGDDRQHGARIRRHDGLLPGRRRDAGLPAAHRPHARTRWSWSSDTPRNKALFRTDDAPVPELHEDALARPGHGRAVAWPARNGRRTAFRCRQMKTVVSRSRCELRSSERGFALGRRAVRRNGHGQRQRSTTEIGHGAVVIAAITSCTNTSNPSVMLAAGLLAKKAVERGLQVKPLREDQPGARLARGDRLSGQGRTDRTACSSWASTPSATAARPASATAARCRTGGRGRRPTATWSPSAVLSGNRNFEGRVNPLVKANYLASPPLVVAYALAGTTDIDLTTEPLGQDADGQDVFCRDIWPTQEEIEDAVDRSRRCPRCSQSQYAQRFRLERHVESRSP